MVKVLMSGKTLVIQSRNERPVVEEYRNWYAVQNRIDNLHQRGLITNQRYAHLSALVGKNTVSTLRKA